jgi:hypothetical protein
MLKCGVSGVSTFGAAGDLDRHDSASLVYDFIPG